MPCARYGDPFWHRLVSDPALLDIAEQFVGPDIALFQTHVSAMSWGHVGETIILLHPPLPFGGVSIGMERERQQK